MPRQARKVSSTGYMHVIVRGIGKQLLFEDHYDYQHYISLLERFCMETGVRVCAYCLMDNHVHMLISGDVDKIALMMKKLGVSYSGYFNHKYDRVGHLFQDRYKSEPVEDEAYLLTVFRYILQNPQKAGICRASGYAWSSYGAYDNPPDYMDIDLIKGLLGSKRQYATFIAADNDDQCLEYDVVKRDDEWALDQLRKCLGISSGTELQNYDRVARNEALAQLKKRGLTIRQIERLTGISRNIVQRVTKE